MFYLKNLSIFVSQLKNDTMTNKFSFDLIRLDLSTIKTVEDCKKILFDNNISESDVNPSKALDLKKIYDTVFLDSKTLFIVAYISKNRKDITFVNDLIEDMLEMKSINSRTRDTSELTVDFILDKINRFGFKSLTTKEQKFLESTSKK